jgi:hypothetical protein
MQKVFPSKIGLEFVLPMGLVFSSVVFLTASSNNTVAQGILLFTMLAVIHLLTNTNYTVDVEQLIIKCGFLYKKTLDINTIRKISKTNDPMSAPAASLDRLRIDYGKYDHILVSPREKAAFVQAILDINPNVEILEL